jgi:hypothetical protein
MSAFDIRAITHFVRAETVDRRSASPARQPSPKKSPASRSATTASFLALLGDYGLLGFAALDVENGNRGIALPEDDLILPIIGNASSAVYFRKKHLGIEQELCFALHCRAHLLMTVSTRFAARIP